MNSRSIWVVVFVGAFAAANAEAAAMLGRSGISAAGGVSSGPSHVLSMAAGEVITGTRASSNYALLSGGLDTYPQSLVGAEEPPAVTANRLYLAGPNPSRYGTALGFDMVQGGRVQLAIYDMQGRRIRTLVNEVRSPGRHSVAWNGRNEGGMSIPVGVYFAELQIGGARMHLKVAVLQ